MTSRTAFSLRVVTPIVLILVAAILFVAWSSGSASSVARGEYQDLAARHQATLQQLEFAEREKLAEAERFSAERIAMTEQLATLNAKLSEKRAAQVEEAVTAAESAVTESNAPLSFGKWAELDAIKNADWNELAGAVESINDLVLEMVEDIENGEGVDAEIQDKIRAQNNTLVRYAAQIMGKIPTHSPVNGEFSHPITLANLTAKMLERSGNPIREDQKSAIATLGAEYDGVYEELQSGYDDGTPRLKKLIDELELKREAMNRFHDVLDESQARLVVHPNIHDRLSLDTLSPATMAIMLAQSGKASSVDELRERFARQVSKSFRLDAEQSGVVKSIADSWIEDLQPLLTPVDAADRFLQLDRVIAAGKAQASAFEKLLELPGLDDRARKAILVETSWGVPSIVPRLLGR